MMKPLLCGLMAAVAALAVGPDALAQAYPSRPVKIVVSFAAGSGSDIIARVLAEDLRLAFGQAFVVDNKPGASAQIAAEYVAKSPPDGYTLFATSNTAHSANPFLFKTLRYDPVKDFTSITRVLYLPYVLVVPPSSPARDISDLVARARANPGKMNYGYGNSTSQLAGAAFVRQGKLEATAVPYKSMPPAMTDLMAGRIDFLFVDLTSAQGYLKSGQIKPIAFSLEKRSSQRPDLPAVAEASGFQGYEVTSWVGIVGPAGMPRDVVTRLNTELRKTLAKPEVREKLEGMGGEVAPSTPEEMDKFVRRQLDSWRTKIRDAGIQPE
jgi:tripartite-type tricarboxylate transporter receptor subunit TctC